MVTGFLLTAYARVRVTGISEKPSPSVTTTLWRGGKPVPMRIPPDGETGSPARLTGYPADLRDVSAPAHSDDSAQAEEAAVYGTIRVVVATSLEPIDIAAWARRYARVVLEVHVKAATSSEAA